MSVVNKESDLAAFKWQRHLRGELERGENNTLFGNNSAETQPRLSSAFPAIHHHALCAMTSAACLGPALGAAEAGSSVLGAGAASAGRLVLGVPGDRGPTVVPESLSSAEWAPEAEAGSSRCVSGKLSRPFILAQNGAALRTPGRTGCGVVGTGCHLPKDVGSETVLGLGSEPGTEEGGQWTLVMPTPQAAGSGRRHAQASFFVSTEVLT